MMKSFTHVFSFLSILMVLVLLIASRPPQAQAFNFFQTIQNLWNKPATPKQLPTSTPQKTPDVQRVVTPSTGSNTSSQKTTNAAVTFRYTKPNFFLKITGVKKATYILEYTRTAKGQDYVEGLQGGGKALKNNVYSKSIYGGTQSSRYFIPHTIKNGNITVLLTKLDGSTVTYKAIFTIVKNKLVISSQQYQ